MKVFVTGGNGFIGSAVVRTLLESGHEVVCLLRPTSNTARIEGRKYERVTGDVRDYAAILEGATGCDAVVNLAAISAWDAVDSPEGREVTLKGIQNVLRAAEERGGVRVVHCSSMTASGGRADRAPMREADVARAGNAAGLPYAEIKQESERLCADAVSRGQDVVVVLPAETYGPNDTGLITAKNLVDFLKSAPVLVCNGGTSIAHVDDVAMGIVRALEKGVSGQRYILGGPNVTLKELASLTLECAGVSKRVVTVPNAVLRAVTKMATFLSLPLPYDPKVVPYATRYWFVDNAKATRELGVSFRSAKDTLAPTVQWLREAGHAP